MNRLTASLRYVRDVSEVLFVDRFKAPPPQRDIARETGTIVRRARFHAHAKIKSLELAEIVDRLRPEGVSEVTLVGPRELCGVGNATYYHALGSITRGVDPTSVLEFGTYLGVGTLTMALNSDADCRIVTVDLPDDPLVSETHRLSAGDVELIARRSGRVGEAFLESSTRERITQVRADSLSWRPDDSFGPIDLVLIDSGHSAPIVRADTENAFRLLSPTGTILWDDYFYLYPDVVEYLDGLADEGRRLHVVGGTNLVIYDARLN
jgi:hypothetical protein